MPALPLIDTHVHLWDRSVVQLAWTQGHQVLERDFRPADFREACAGIEVEGIVFVEAAVDPGCHLAEAAWVAEQAVANPWIGAMVAHAPLHLGQAATADLERLSQHAALRGIRRLIQGEAVDFCLQPAFVEGVKLLPRFDLHFELCIYHPQLGATVELVRRCPEVRFILDHIGKPGIEDGLMEPWASQLRELARLDNVVCKMSGLVTEADHAAWTREQLRPYIDHVIDCFGFDRVLFGSDWPVQRLASPYGRWVETLDWALQACSADELRKLYRDNAIRFYRLADA